MFAAKTRNFAGAGPETFRVVQRRALENLIRDGLGTTNVLRHCLKSLRFHSFCAYNMEPVTDCEKIKTRLVGIYL